MTTIIISTILTLYISTILHIPLNLLPNIERGLGVKGIEK